MKKTKYIGLVIAILVASMLPCSAGGRWDFYIYVKDKDTGEYLNDAVSYLDTSQRNGYYVGWRKLTYPKSYGLEVTCNGYVTVSGTLTIDNSKHIIFYPDEGGSEDWGTFYTYAFTKTIELEEI